LSITDLNIDDRGILQLNGVTIDSAGIFGPGTTTLDLTPSARPLLSRTLPMDLAVWSSPQDSCQERIH
jgi:hypothetical protein